MNSPKKRLGAMCRGCYRHVPSKSGNAGITIDQYVTIFKYGGEPKFHVSKQSAIDWAEAILTAYGVPFCNRVPGAGTGAE